MGADLQEMEMSLIFTVILLAVVVIGMYLIAQILLPYLLEACLYILIWGCTLN